MTTRLLLAVILGLLLLISLFVLPILRWPLVDIHLFVVALLMAMLFGETTVAVASAIIGGFMIDLLSAGLFGSTLITFVAAVAITRWLFRTRITNRSFMAFLSLVLIGVFLAEIIGLFLNTIGRVIDPRAIGPSLTDIWAKNVGQVGLQAVLSASLVYLLVRASGRKYATLTQHEF